MINCIKSEYYRLIRKKELYWIIVISLGLVAMAILVLNVSLSRDANFPYATNRFLYLNVLTMTPLIILIGMMINQQLLGKDQAVMKQLIAFGIPRKTIFLTKLILTMIPFILVCVMGIAIVIIGGESFLQVNGNSGRQFEIAVVNLAPLVISAFILGHSLMMVLPNEIYSIAIVLFVFSRWFSELVSFLEKTILGSNRLMYYLPSTQVEQITNDFLGEKATFLPASWLIGILLVITSLLVGVVLFDKKDI